MNSKTMIILLLLLLSSCGGFEKEKKTLLTKKEHKDLINSFNLSKEQADLYKEKESHVEIVMGPEDKGEKEKIQTIKKTKKKKLGKKIKEKIKNKEEIELKGKAEIKKKEEVQTKEEVKEEIKVKEEVVSQPAPAIIVENIQAPEAPPIEFEYPSDYPQELKDFDSVSKSIWEKFKPIFYQGEESIMAISYLGVTAGYITISSKDVVNISDKPAYHYYARFKSKDIYHYFYWLDDTLETFIEKSTFLPIKYALIQREKKQNVDDLELFDFKKLKTFHWYKRVKEGSDKDEKIENYIPRFSQDSFSALQFVRGLPLHKGDRYDFPVVTRGKPWLLKVEVMGEEIISVNGTDVKSYRLKAETHFPGVLQKSGDINFWYSADESRKLVKFQAKVKIGSIYGELIEYKPGVLIK